MWRFTQEDLYLFSKNECLIDFARCHHKIANLCKKVNDKYGRSFCNESIQIIPQCIHVNRKCGKKYQFREIELFLSNILMEKLWH